jgi:hypothetical protein
MGIALLFYLFMYGYINDTQTEYLSWQSDGLDMRCFLYNVQALGPTQLPIQ